MWTFINRKKNISQFTLYSFFTLLNNKPLILISKTYANGTN